MGMMIGFIAPYAELAELASEVRSELDLDFPVAVGLLEGAPSCCGNADPSRCGGACQSGRDRGIAAQ